MISIVLLAAASTTLGRHEAAMESLSGVRDMACWDGFCYAVLMTGEIRMLDMSMPTGVVAGTTYIPSAELVEVHTSVLLVATPTFVLVLSRNMTVVGTVQEAAVKQLLFIDSKAALLNNGTAFLPYNLTDPTHPVKLPTAITCNCHGVQSGGILFAQNLSLVDRVAIEIYDVGGDPSAPRLIGDWVASACMLAANDRAVVVLGNKEIQPPNITSDNPPQLPVMRFSKVAMLSAVTEWNFKKTAVSADGTLAYISSSSLLAYNITTSVAVAATEVRSGSVAIQVIGATLYTAPWRCGIIAYETTESLHAIGTAQSWCTSRMVPVGDLIFVYLFDFAWEVYDISSPRAPTFAGIHREFNNLRWVDGNNIISGPDEGKDNYFDIYEPTGAAITHIGGYQNDSMEGQIFVSGVGPTHQLYFTLSQNNWNYDMRLNITDTSRVSLASLSARKGTYIPVRSFTDNLLFTGEDNVTYAHSVSIAKYHSDNATWVRMSQFAVSRMVASFAVAGDNMLFVFLWEEAYVVYDISDPSRPVFVVARDMPSGIKTVTHPVVTSDLIFFVTGIQDRVYYIDGYEPRGSIKLYPLGFPLDEGIFITLVASGSLLFVIREQRTDILHVGRATDTATLAQQEDDDTSTSLWWFGVVGVAAILFSILAFLRCRRNSVLSVSEEPVHELSPKEDVDDERKPINRDKPLAV
eukprot:TRINITY_DN9281_c1_g5_i1.p1 TRINITY_DN9281_c1_g5~~TRINITY_DN9281_c1_g5_i1.p1  ORF type:complete len:692 (+),score=106.80 TRINITY_DN9281_c1_g5_i1:33-2108(+)